MAFINLFFMFFRIGLFSFGGGLAMLPLIFQSVQDFGIMAGQEFSDLVALSQVTPGPIAVNAATFVGFKYAGVLGSISATLGVILPSFIIMLVVMKFMEKYYESKGLQGVLTGIRPVVVGLIASAVVFLGETTFTFALKTDNIIMMCMLLVTVILAGKFKVSPIILTIAMGVIGAFLCG